MKRFILIFAVCACFVSASPVGWPGFLDYTPAYHYYLEHSPEQAVIKAHKVAQLACPTNCLYVIKEMRQGYDCDYTFAVTYTRIYVNPLGQIVYSHYQNTDYYRMQYLKRNDDTWRGWFVNKR